MPRAPALPMTPIFTACWDIAPAGSDASTSSYAHYQRALRLDPAHLGAHEYLGELYLQRGEPEQARAQLAELELLCPAGCEERSELADAILAQGTASAP